MPFLFVNELEENDSNAKSKYGFAVRSHVRRRAITERRRKNAPPRIKRQLLQRESSLQRIEDLRSGLNPAGSLPSIGSNRLMTNDSVEAFGLDEHGSANQFLVSGDLKETGSADFSKRRAVPRNPLRKAHPRSRNLAAERQAMRQAPWHSGHTNSGANLDASQMHQVGMYMKSTQGSPTSILGAGKVDPFRRYPLDANKCEEETGLFERYQSQDLTIKFSYQYHENLLHQFNICQASVMCFRPSDAQINASFSAMMIEG